MLSDFYYISRSTHPRGHASDVDILQIAQENNASANISGRLIRGKSWFAQVLEGETKIIRPLSETIRRDTRHSDLLFWRTDSLTARKFPSWRVIMADSEKYAAMLLHTMRDDIVHNDFKLRALQAVLRRHDEDVGLTMFDQNAQDSGAGVTRPELLKYSP